MAENRDANALTPALEGAVVPSRIAAPDVPPVMKALEPWKPIIRQALLLKYLPKNYPANSRVS